MRLEHKVALVTGGGTGIGEAIAKVFAREGAKVVVTGRRKDQLERVVREIGRTGKQALAVAGSVTNEADVREAVAATVRTFGRLRSEEHTSELQSLRHLVCRLLLEKKNKTQ